MPRNRKVLHLISQAHLDPIWLWPVRDGIAETLTTMQSAVDRSTEVKQFKFSRSSASSYRWAKEMDPQLHRNIQKLVNVGRWEVIGGWVEQPDCNLPGTESFLRQALYAKAFFAEEFGPKGETRIGYNVDSFGHAGGLPQILKKSGFDQYVFARGDEKENEKLPLLFWWESPDGSRVLTQRVPRGCYAQNPAATGADIEATVRLFATEGFAPGFEHGVMWFGVGNHGGGPTRAHVAKLLELKKDSSLPELRFSSLREYFEAVKKDPAFASLPVVSKELQFTFRGCYSATGVVKALHRQSEKALFRAEALQVLNGRANPAELREAWWKLLLNEFHDVLAGTCVLSTEEETRHRFGATLTTAQDAALRDAYSMARRVDTRAEKGSVLFVANPLPWKRKALVQLDTFITHDRRVEITHLETKSGKVVPIQWLKPEANFGPFGMPWGKLTAVVELPPGGYRVLRVATKPVQNAAEPSAKGAVALQQFVNDHATTEANNGSRGSTDPALHSLCINEKEILSAPVGVVCIKDTSGTWGHGTEDYRTELGRPEIIETKLLENGPLVTVTRQKMRWQSSEIWMDVIRYVHTTQIGLHFRINWQEKRQLLKLEVPTRLAETTVFAKMPGEVAKREPLGHEEPCHDWVALSGIHDGKRETVALLSDSCYSYDAKDGALRMILVRGVPYAEHPPFLYKDDSSAPFLDQGWQERRFWLASNEGAWTSLALDRLALEWQVPADFMLDSGHPGTEPWEKSLFSVEPRAVSVLCLKPAENGRGVILRVQEAAGKKCNARVRWQGHEFVVPLSHWEIKSLRLCMSKGKLVIQTVDALENQINEPEGAA